MKIIVSGPIANKPGNGGGAWERMSWLLGLQRLGCDVCFVEQIGRDACVNATASPTKFGECVNLAWFRSIADWFDVRDRSALVFDDGGQTDGIPLPELLDIAASAELLVNLSGHLTFSPILERVRQKAYVDVDPGFTQFWHCDPGTPFQLPDHDYYFTIGENIGSPNCLIPTGGIDWLSTRQPVLLNQWPFIEPGSHRRFTTIASWRGPFGAVHGDGKSFGLKVHEFRKFFELPARVDADFELALDIHPADQRDRVSLEQNGWRLSDPRRLAHPAAFRQFVQESDAEFSVAQGVYVDTNSGWFSERSARYLASGKPVLVQETGFSRQLPTGEGLLSFRTFDEAVKGVEAIASDYSSHARAARRIAEQYFDSDIVLSRFLNQVEMKAAIA